VKARALSVASLAAAGLLLVSGCATAITGTPRAATTLPTTETSVAEPTTEESTETSTTAAETSATPVPPTAPVTEPVDNDDAGNLDADSVAWLSAFCYGFDDVMQYADPDVNMGMADDAIVQTVSDAYNGMAQAALEAAYQLDGMAAPTFPGADTIAPALFNWLVAVASVYSEGAEAIATTTFHSAGEFEAMIDEIEDGMAEATDELGLAMSDVDPSVKATVAALPECATLIGG
jgi:hypothetical protein